MIILTTYLANSRNYQITYSISCYFHISLVLHLSKTWGKQRFLGCGDFTQMLLCQVSWQT